MDCYCIMVKTGGEEKFKACAAEKFSAGYGSLKFWFFKKQMRARAGVSFLEPLFPGYVFIETESLERKKIEILKEISGFYHFLDRKSVV